MEIENIKDCINIAGNAGHNIEHRRAMNELKNAGEALRMAKLLIIAIKHGEIKVFDEREDNTGLDYVQLLEKSLNKI
jgi:hypothetical protein